MAAIEPTIESTDQKQVLTVATIKSEEKQPEVIHIDEEKDDIVVIAWIKAKTTKRALEMQPDPESTQPMTQLTKRAKMDVEATLPLSPPVEGSPWGVLHAMHPNLEYLQKRMASPHNGNRFIVNVKVCDKIFEGIGSNRKIAKKEAARQALLFMFGIKFK